MKIFSATLHVASFVLGIAGHPTVRATANDTPNVILIVTDDQGYGDMSCHGNPWLQTPHLDRLAAQSVQLDNYHVDPVCTPTRAALMTGRYCTRVGAWHVTQGRQLLAVDETTMADIFKNSGYRTGIFGKWHLGDPYPFAPRFRGFQEAVVHRSGGVNEVGNPTNNDYFDDTYYRNGIAESFEGYCTDVWFNEAMEFISDTPTDKPFFVYLPTNAMHSPHIVAPKYSERFLQQGLPEKRSHFYGMIENFDENLGRLLSFLTEAELDENTILIFMGDNGTAQGSTGKSASSGTPDPTNGFNAGMRGKKGSVYEGGHRVACFVRWPGHLPAGSKVEELTSHRDWLPTLIDLCGLEHSHRDSFDATSIAPLLRGDNAHWPERTLFVERQRDKIRPSNLQQTPNNVPLAVLTERWRMVNGELYDIHQDPSQTRNIASQNQDIVNDLYQLYRRHYSKVMEHGGEPVAIPVGHPDHPAATLTVRDWHPTLGSVIWQHEQLDNNDLQINGWWQINVWQTGQYQIKLRRFPAELDRPMHASAAEIKVNGNSLRQELNRNDSSVTFEVTLESGSQRFQASLIDFATDQSRGAYFVEVSQVDEKARR